MNRVQTFLYYLSYLWGVFACVYTGVVMIPQSVALAVAFFVFAAVAIAGFFYQLRHRVRPVRRKISVWQLLWYVFLIAVFAALLVTRSCNGVVLVFGIGVVLIVVERLYSALGKSALRN